MPNACVDAAVTHPPYAIDARAIPDDRVGTTADERLGGSKMLRMQSQNWKEAAPHAGDRVMLRRCHLRDLDAVRVEYKFGAVVGLVSRSSRR